MEYVTGSRRAMVIIHNENPAHGRFSARQSFLDELFVARRGTKGIRSPIVISS